MGQGKNLRQDMPDILGQCSPWNGYFGQDCRSPIILKFSWFSVDWRGDFYSSRHLKMNTDINCSFRWHILSWHLIFFFFDTWFSGSTSFSVFLYLRKLWRYTGKGLNQRMRLLQTGNTEMSSLNLEPERWKHMVRGHDRHMWLYCIVSFLNKHQYWKISVNLTKMTGFSHCIFSVPNNAWVLHYSAHAAELDVLWHSDDNLLSIWPL
jgi:hypothetical protein